MREEERLRWAKSLQDNPLWGEIIESFTADIIRQWEFSDPEDQAGRERMWIAKTMLSRLRDTIAASVEYGKYQEAVSNE